MPMLMALSLHLCLSLSEIFLFMLSGQIINDEKLWDKAKYNTRERHLHLYVQVLLGKFLALCLRSRSSGHGLQIELPADFNSEIWLWTSGAFFDHWSPKPFAAENAFSQRENLWVRVFCGWQDWKSAGRHPHRRQLVLPQGRVLQPWWSEASHEFTDEHSWSILQEADGYGWEPPHAWLGTRRSVKTSFALSAHLLYFLFW